MAILSPAPEQTRYEQGKSARQNVPRASHAQWSPTADRTDPVAILESQDTKRIASLVPIRHQRMSQSPFAFYRGAAAIIAYDLASTPATGSRVQACGDSHLANFGAFATPERNLIFDVNDFDETLEAPWEWDVKRLAASAILAARELDLGAKRCRQAALAVGRSYRKSIQKYARMTALDVWYSRIDAEELVKRLKDAPVCREITKEEQLAHERAHEHISPRLVSDDAGSFRIIDNEPLVFHFVSDEASETEFRQALSRYTETLHHDVRILFQRYHVVDLAMKVVGIGSVGTRCAIALCQADPGDLLLLQIKEAMESVLEPYAGKSAYDNHGERCVTGQRTIQAASDLFLSWTSVASGHDYYVRQLRDMKAGVDLTRMNESDIVNYVSLCATALARGHARSGDSAFIAGYLGSSNSFDEAVADFALAYVDQTDRDYQAFLDALKSGRILSAGTISGA